MTYSISSKVDRRHKQTEWDKQGTPAGQLCLSAMLWNQKKINKSHFMRLVSLVHFAINEDNENKCCESSFILLNSGSETQVGFSWFCF